MEGKPAGSQALITRYPSMTQKEFSDHWYNKHAPIVLPYFLSFGFQYYAQVLPFHPAFFPRLLACSFLAISTANMPQTHGPLTSKNEEVQKILGDFDGAAQSINPAPSTEPVWPHSSLTPSLPLHTPHCSISPCRLNSSSKQILIDMRNRSQHGRKPTTTK